MSTKEKFIELYKANITRPGADKLLEYLEKTDFFTAPASTRFHLCSEGGLVEHSIHVYERLFDLVSNEVERSGMFNNIEAVKLRETVAICGLLHDVCKAGVYQVSTRNVKGEDGKWRQEPFYKFDDPMPYGHGEKSVYIVNGFMRLTREEAFAIRYHMGFSGTEDDRNVGKAFSMYPLAMLTHEADMMATYLDEREDA